MLRQLAFLDFQVPGTWLQPVLVNALALKAISMEEYVDAVVHLIDAGLEFVSVSTDILEGALRGADGSTLPNAFLRLASRLGGRNAELSSHVPVALNAIVRVWTDETLPLILRRAALGRLLESFAIGRSMDELQGVLREFIGRDPWDSSNSLTDYVIGWLRGHFLSFS